MFLITGVLAACGGGGSDGCTVSPSPQFHSSPPTVAVVDETYVYGIDATHGCPFGPCRGVVGVQLPPGAVISGSSLSWTPTASQVNTNVQFVVATKPDLCFDQATQSWSVHVLPVPPPPPPPPPPPAPSCGGGVTERLNVSSEECEANQDTTFPGVDLSDDGRYASFISSATNLVVGDNNNRPDVFIRDRITGVTTKILFADDWPSTSISGDGSLVAIRSNSDIKVVNTQTLVSEVIARGDGPSMSGDGRYVAFHSLSALIPEDSNSDYDIYVYDRQDSIMRRVSESSAGSQADNSSFWPVISADGSTVAFSSFATNLIASDTNGQADVFLHKLNSSETQLVSITPGGGQFDGKSDNQPGISADGRFVVFGTEAPFGIFLRDVIAGTTIKIGVQGIDPDISADGRYVVYRNTNTFVYDVQTQQTMLAAEGLNGDPPNAGGWGGLSISSDGKFIAFASDATNLVPGDTNAVRDVFIVENPLFP